MFKHPFLNPIEVLVARWLSRSPRVGLVVIKEHSSLVSWVIRDESDLCSAEVEDEDFPEPASMQLERLYHAPDAQR